MEKINWNYPTTIWFGVDRIIEIQKACEELNIQNPLIVTDNGILKTNIIKKLNDCLDKHAFIFSDVKSILQVRMSRMVLKYLMKINMME